MVFSSWRALIGPRSLNAEQIAYWEALAARATEQEEWTHELEINSLTPAYMGSEATRKLFAQQAGELRSILSELGLACVLTEANGLIGTLCLFARSPRDKKERVTMSSYAESVLADGEKIVHRAAISHWKYAFNYLVGALFCGQAGLYGIVAAS